MTKISGRGLALLTALMLALLLIGAPGAAACDLGLRATTTAGRETLDERLLDVIAREAGCPVHWRNLPITVARRLQMLRDGELDVIPGASISAERQVYALFSRPYRRERVQVYVHPSLLPEQRPRRLDDVANSQLTVVALRQAALGPAFETLKRRLDAEGRLRLASSLSAAMQLMSAVPARAHVLIADDFSVTVNSREMGQVVIGTDITVASNDVHLMFARGDHAAALVARIDAAIARLQQRGDLRRVLDKDGLATLALP